MIQNTQMMRENWLYQTGGPSSVAESNGWTSLWHTQVPSKIRVFLWRLARESTPTNDLLHHRNMANSPACRLCGAADSWRHALLDCNMARSIWALAPEALVEVMSTNSDPNARGWLFNMQSRLNHADFTRLGVTLWAIWSSRRKVIYEDVHQTPYSTNAFVNSFITDMDVLV